MGREVLRQDGIGLEASALRGVPEAGAPVWLSEAVVQVQEHESEEGGKEMGGSGMEATGFFSETPIPEGLFDVESIVKPPEPGAQGRERDFEPTRGHGGGPQIQCGKEGEG